MLRAGQIPTLAKGHLPQLSCFFFFVQRHNCHAKRIGFYMGFYISMVREWDSTCFCRGSCLLDHNKQIRGIIRHYIILTFRLGQTKQSVSSMLWAQDHSYFWCCLFSDTFQANVLPLAFAIAEAEDSPVTSVVHNPDATRQHDASQWF